MKKINLSPDLESFLRKEKVLTRFKKNILDTFSKIDDISLAFIWNNTPEKRDFWRDLHYKFQKEQNEKV